MAASRDYATEHPLTTDKDISSEAFWRQSFAERDQTFAWLRRNAPVSWHKPFESREVTQEVHGEAGFWAVTRADDIRYVSLNPALFSSARRTVMLRPEHPDTKQRPTFIQMDPPQHMRYRGIMSQAFTPKGVARINDKINERAARIIDRVVGAGRIDFVTEVAAKLPMLTIADMVGVPDSLAETFAHAADNFSGARDLKILPPGVSIAEFSLQQLDVLRQIGVDLVKHRREHPSNDIATALANAEIDGRKLDDDDITSMMLLLATGGNETTRQTTASTLIALERNPEQKAWLKEDLEGRIVPAVEEFLRHATPVMNFARTATQDTELGGQQITAGDKVAIFYCSGNRDEAVFDDPHRFDLSRFTGNLTPRSHVAFGGGGAHYCIGHWVAKAQLRALYTQILTKLTITEVGEPEQLYSEFFNGYRHLQVTVG